MEPLAPAIWKRSSYMVDDESECSSIDSDADSDCSTDDEAIGSVSPTKTPKRRQVTFAEDVKFQSTRPRRSYRDRGIEVIKVDVEPMAEDEHRAVKVEFAKHKARLNAQIMKDMVKDEEDGDRVAYVRLPGTSKVAEVAFYDGEDEMMETNLSSGDSKEIIEKGIFRCMVQPVILRKKIKFLMDTGCGHDLISKKKIEKDDLETLVTPEPISFQTANGVTDTDLMSNFQTESFKEPINSYVLDDTPSVLSIGKRCMNHDYGFVWPPGREPFMIDPEGKRISLFVTGDIPYVRAGSSKSLAHDDAEATAVLKALTGASEVQAETAAAAKAIPGELDGEGEGVAHDRPPDPDPHEVPSEEVPAAEAGRPPDPPGGGIGDMEFGENDEREIDVEGEGAPSKIGTLKAEANTLADLCTHRYRNPYCESCIRAKMKHFRTKRGAFQRELKSWGDLITFDFLDMRRAADAGLGIDDGAREVLVVRDIATRVIAAIPTESRHTDQVVNALKRLFRIPKTQSQDGLQRRCA